MGSGRWRQLFSIFIFPVFLGCLIILSGYAEFYPAWAETHGEIIAEAYTVGVEDVLEISVWQNQDLSRTVIVRPDGKISLPLVDDIQAAGLSTQELKQAIIDKLKSYVAAPDVVVIVQQINSWRIYVQGEVQNPGVLTLRSHTSIAQLISIVGGFTEFAKKNKIKVIRRKKGHTEIFKINYNKIISGDSADEDIYLRPGDTIIVP